MPLGSLHLRASLVGLLLFSVTQAADAPAPLRETYFPALSAQIGRELRASLQAMPVDAPVPATLFGEPLGGSFTWSTLALTLSRYRALEADAASVLGADPEPWIRRGLDTEVDGQGTTFSQLYVARILYTSCTTPGDLATSALWTALPAERQEAYRAFLDIRRFYQEQTGDMGGRPNNYFGVALLLEAYRHRLGLTDDPDRLDRLFATCLALLERDGGYLDDHRRFQGSFDRYLHEYVRFVWEAAEVTGRDGILTQIEPAMRRCARLWWDLLHPRLMISSLWGRSLQNSWDDTFEQAAFFAARPAIAPAPAAQLAAAFTAAAAVYFDVEYNAERHLNRMLEPGRGTWSYAGRNRIWSYTLGTLGKLAEAAAELRTALHAQQVGAWPTAPTLEPLERYETFRSGPGGNFGVWIRRTAEATVVLPVAGNAGVADYLPFPRGLPGWTWSVQQTLPILTPFFQRGSEPPLVAGQGADRVQFDADTSTLRLEWDQLRDPRGQPVDAPARVRTRWTQSDDTLLLVTQLAAEAAAGVTGAELWIPLAGTVTTVGHALHVRSGQVGWIITPQLPAGATLEVGPPENDAQSRGPFEPVTAYARIRIPTAALAQAEPAELRVEFRRVRE